MINLNGMKRSALQKLAKQHGIKANIKTDKIIEALSEILKNDSNPQFTVDTCSSASESAQDSTLDYTETSQGYKESTPKVSSQPNKHNTTFDKLPGLLGEVKPPWEDGSCTEEDASNPEQKRRGQKRKNPSVVPSRRTRSASQDKNVSSLTQNKATTPSNESIKKRASNKTFSVEKPVRNRRLRSKSADVKQTAETEEAPQKKSKRGGYTIEEQNKILDEIQKHIEEQGGGLGTSSGKTFIPRFQATGVTIPDTNKTPGQAKWDKVHKKQFDMLESIDDYNKRKQERAQKLLGSSKSQRIQALSRLAKPVERKTKKATAPIAQPTFMSPMSRKIIKSATSTQKAKSPSTKTKAKPPVSFQPVLTTNKMDLNFGRKASKLVTPKKVIKPDAKKLKTPTSTLKNGRVNTPVRTPCKPNIISTPNTAKKNVFDLKESLKKPLTWVPHKGPLKRLNEPHRKRTNLKDRMKNYKQPNIGSRETRRLKAKENRDKLKAERMLGRRGIK